MREPTLPIDPADRAQMIAWAREHTDPLSWRAQYALDHPDDAMTTGNNYTERLEHELLANAQEMYRAVVPDGFVVAVITDHRAAHRETFERAVDELINAQRDYADALRSGCYATAQTDALHRALVQQRYDEGQAAKRAVLRLWDGGEE